MLDAFRYNRFAEVAINEKSRLFAELNVALADAAIMAWDAKYDTNFWRPITAIRAADTDGNANTEKTQIGLRWSLHLHFRATFRAILVSAVQQQGC